MPIPITEVIPEEKQVEDNIKPLWSNQLDAFELIGDVHTVQYDSICLKYDKLGNLEFFGLNDSINLLKNVKYKKVGYASELKEWGDNGWTFNVDGQDTSCELEEGPIVDFTIRNYNEKKLKRYTVFHDDIKFRPSTPKFGDKEYQKHHDRKIIHRARVILNDRGGKIIYFLNYSNYVYDDYGNWIERKVKSDEEPTKIVKRKITYYSQE